MPFALDERITRSRSHYSRRLPFHVMSTTRDLPGDQNPYGASLNTLSPYAQQHPLLDVALEGPPPSSLYAPSSVGHGPSHNMKFSDDIFGEPLQDRPHHDPQPQLFSNMQDLNILYGDPARVHVPHSLEPNDFTAQHAHELVSECRRSRRRRQPEAYEPSNNNATTSVASYEAGQAPILDHQPTARRHIRDELTFPLPIASHSGHTSGFDYQPSARDYELQDWSSVHASAFDPEQPFGLDRQYTAHGDNRDDTLSQYPSPFQSDARHGFACQSSSRGHDFQDWTSENPAVSQPDQAFESDRQPIGRGYDRDESLSQYLAPAHSGHTPDLTYQQTARGYDSQGWLSDNPTISQAGQIYGLDRHPRAYGSTASGLLSQYPLIRHYDQTGNPTYTPGARGYSAEDESSEGSIDSQDYSVTGLSRQPRVQGRGTQGSVHRDVTGFQANQDNLPSTLFDTRGRTAQKPSPEVIVTSPNSGISRSPSASPNRARAAGPPQLNKAIPPLPSLARSHTIGSSVSATRDRALAPLQLATSVSALGRSNTTGGSVSPVRGMHELPEDLEDEDDHIHAASSAEIGGTSRRRRHREPTKGLFGPKGILSRPMTTGQMNEQSRQHEGKGKKALQRFKDKVRTITSDVRHAMTSNTNTQPSAQPPIPEPPRHPPVSLSPAIQARLFGELELILTTTINTYLKNENAEGRMSLESVEKMVKKWKASHQPLPTEFMFDLGTQLRLVQANCETFRFYGEHQGSSVRIHAMFKAWEGLAKRLNRRTLATPDAEIRKYVADISNILALLGASAETWTTFEFWRSAVAVAIEAVGAEERARAATPWGVTRQVYTGPE